MNLEDVIDRQSAMDDSLKALKYDLKNVVEDNERIKELLLAIADHHNINLSREDD